jgi:calcineurin-like phosphoesterase family protein
MPANAGLTCLGAIVLVLGAGVPAAVGAKPDQPVLKLIVKDTPKPNYGKPVPKKVSGRVTLRTKGAGVGGVSVTDGYSVVKTDAQGAYTLTPSQDAVFIYITRPAGYDMAGDWYKPVAAKVDFMLEPAAGDEAEYIFVHVTDTHIHSARSGLAGLSRFVREVNAFTPKPAFVVNSGDLLSLHKALVSSAATGRAWFRNYVGIMNHLSVPYYNVAGDHTDSCYRIEEFPRGDHRCGKPLYWEHLGPHFFSFEYGKIHFVSVDFGYHLGKRKIRVGGKDLEYPTNGVQPMHVKWLKQDMAGRTKGSFVVTTSESDLTRFCPGFLEMAKQHDVRLQLTGDDHVVAYNPRPVPYRTGGSLSGCWWNPKSKGLCPDLSPQGYLVYRVTGEEMECFYKGLGRRVEIVSPRMGAPWQGRVTVRAHIVQPKPSEALQYSLDGKDWKAMPEAAQPFLRSVHETTVDTTSLPDGLVDFRVRIAPDGESRSRPFVIANGRPPAPAGGDASVAFQVSPNSHVRKAPGGKVDVILNDKVIGTLAPKARKKYTFRIPASGLRKANILSFRFARPGDDMGLSSPILTFQGEPIEDPRDTALKQVRTSHWGPKSADWGGFVAGNGSLREGPFARKQDVFCFILPDAVAAE